MKIIVQVLLGLIVINGGEVLAQGLTMDDPMVVESLGINDPFDPANENERAPGNWSIVYIGSIIVLETVFLAGSILTRYKAGSYTVGGLQGFYAVAAGIGAVTGLGEYGITSGLILVGGLGYLSYYNFKFHGVHTNSRKFWTNFLGMNATVGLAFAGLLFEAQFMDFSIGSLTVTPHLQGLGMQWVF